MEINHFFHNVERKTLNVIKSKSVKTKVLNSEHYKNNKVPIENRIRVFGIARLNIK